MFDALVTELMSRADGRLLATAESCTGGGIAAAITDLPGSSALLDRGFVTYSNAAKINMLGVSEATLAANGAVSEQTAREMVAGALSNSNAQLAVAVTGIAGPGGAVEGKPVGTVYIAVQKSGDGAHVSRVVFPGDRTAVRRATIKFSLEALIKLAT